MAAAADRGVQSRPKPLAPTSRASRSTSHTPLSSSAVLEVGPSRSVHLGQRRPQLELVHASDPRHPHVQLRVGPGEPRQTP